MDQQQDRKQTAVTEPLALNVAIGWFIALVLVLWMMQAPSSRDLATLAACTVLTAMLCIPGAALGLGWALIRKSAYTHSYGLTTASVLLGLVVVAPFANVGHPILDFSDVSSHSQAAAPAESASADAEREWADAYTRFFEDTSKHYLLGPAIKDVFDEKALADANAGVPYWQALGNAEALANQQLDAVVHTWHYVELWKRPEYARLKLPGFERRHKQRVRELLAAGSEPMAALFQGANQVIAEIDSLN